MSLTSRIAAVGALVVIALLMVAASLFDASRQSRESFRWVTHSSRVIDSMNDSVAGIRDAESGLRGYVLSQNPRYALSFDRRLDDSLKAFQDLVELTKDNPGQRERITVFGNILNVRAELLRQHLALAQANRFEEAKQGILQGGGLDTMNALVAASEDFLREERRIQQNRIQATEVRVTWSSRLALYGVPMVALLSLFVSFMVIQGIRKPVLVINHSMTALGAGDLTQRIDESMGSREFNQLAEGYNAMANSLETAAANQKASDQELKRVHQELIENSQTLKERGEVIELLGGMAHRMQAARTDAELAQVIEAFVPRVLPNLPGVLYAHNNSRNLLFPLASWGSFHGQADGFAPDDCWALRRGLGHFVYEPGTDIVCEHVKDKERAYHCEPLLASGEVIGVLYLDGQVDTETGFRMHVLVENIASAMVNHKLQRDLKEQTIRDPLTGLFNRRYMEEALTIEVARSARSGQPLSVVMCDVDHFKRFNDEFGHEAGDMVLQAVGAELSNRFRDGDIVCRYGGEEFMIIAPGTTPEALLPRLEGLREGIAALIMRNGNQTLGNLTMSFGVSSVKSKADTGGRAAVQAADEALYHAKKSGRNRVTIHSQMIAA